MRYVSGEEIHRVLTFAAVVRAMEAGHRRPRMETRDLSMGDEKAYFVVRSAVDRGRALGSKLYTSFPDNLTARSHGQDRLPAVQGMYVLFDGANGRPVAALDGTAITWWKTAADSALGAQLLAPVAPATLLVVGAGAIAPWLVRAHRFARPSIARVLVWNRTGERAADLVTRLRGEGTAAEHIADLERAVRQAEVITSATRSRAPLIMGAWLQPGTHVDLVGGYTPETREADDEAARRARIFVDRRGVGVPRGWRHPGADCQRGDTRGGRAGGPLRPDRRRGAGPHRPRRHHAVQERGRRTPGPHDGPGRDVRAGRGLAGRGVDPGARRPDAAPGSSGAWP